MEQDVAVKGVVSRHDGRVGAVRGGDFDHRQYTTDAVQPGAAVFVWHLDAHQTVLAKQADVFQRKFAAAVEIGSGRRDFFLRDAARHILDHQLLIGKLKVHRSEEHTSELQSLMRISYAVFCLKKKKLYIKTRQ